MINYREEVLEKYPDAFATQEQTELNWWIFKNKEALAKYNAAIGVGATEDQAWEDAYRETIE